MKRLRELFVTLGLVVVTAFPCHAADGQDHSLVVYTADGMRTFFALGDHPKLTANGSTFTITTAAAKTGYEVHDLLRFTLEDDGGETLVDAYWLVISLRDGTIDALPFTDRPKITISDGTFTVTTSGRTIDYAATSIDRFRVTDHYDAGHYAVNADVNADGVVDVADISAVISVMAGSVDAAPSSAPVSADVNRDGTVDVADIATVISVMASR